MENPSGRPSGDFPQSLATPERRMATPFTPSAPTVRSNGPGGYPPPPPYHGQETVPFQQSQGPRFPPGPPVSRQANYGHPNAYPRGNTPASMSQPDSRPFYGSGPPPAVSQVTASRPMTQPPLQPVNGQPRGSVPANSQFAAQGSMLQPLYGQQGGSVPPPTASQFPVVRTMPPPSQPFNAQGNTVPQPIASQGPMTQPPPQPFYGQQGGIVPPPTASQFPASRPMPQPTPQPFNVQGNPVPPPTTTQGPVTQPASHPFYGQQGGSVPPPTASQFPASRPMPQSPSQPFNVQGNSVPPPTASQFASPRPMTQPPSQPFHGQQGGSVPPPAASQFSVSRPMSPPPAQPFYGQQGGTASQFPAQGPMTLHPSQPFYGQQGGAVPPLADRQFPASRPMPPPASQPFYGQQGGIAPPLASQFAAPGSMSQPPSQPFYGQQRGHVPPPPPAGVPFGGLSSREQMPYPMSGPSVGGMVQNLVEDFQSLSIGSTPGSVDAGIDPKALPRPLDGDEEPTSLMERYPFNCHPRFFRLTTHAIPSSQSMLARWHLPLGVVVHPLAEAPKGEEVPVVNFGLSGIVRCRRCRTYINPYVTFTDGGRKWRCNLCNLLNDVPGEYFCSLDANGQRLDLMQRPELSKGCVEFVAPTEYMVRPPMPPVYFFLIDVSVSAVQSGLLAIVAETIKSCLDNLPGFPRTQIGFLTFDSTLHFYSLKSSLTQPQMVVVPDLEDVFLPLPDDLLVNLSDSRHVVDAFLDSLPIMFQDNANVESAFGPALKAAFMVMCQLGGKLLIFQSTLPSLGSGGLRLRGDDLRVYGTDKEHALRIPEDPFYKLMAAEFSKNQISVDIFALSDKYMDIASLGSLAKYTGGQVYHFPSFQAAVHQEKFKFDLVRDLTRETTWEAVLRIRCGKGIRFSTYHGHFMLRSTDLLALPAVDCDKAFAMQLSLEETLMTTQTVYFQVALLHTSSSGERRIRVITTAAPVVTDLAEMYRSADTGAIVTLLSRLAIEKTLSNKLEDARQLMQLKLVKSLKEYRNMYTVQHRLAGRMIFPESLKYLALYVLSLCKSIALRGGYADASLDERCAAGYSMNILPIRRILELLYPSLLRIDGDLMKEKDDFGESLNQLRLTVTSLDPRGLYIYDDGFSFTLWFGGMLPSHIMISLFGSDLSGSPDLSKVTLTERDNEVSRKLLRIITRLREKDPSSYQLCQMVRQGEQPREGALLLTKFVEDQMAGTSSYIDWIMQISRQLQN